MPQDDIPYGKIQSIEELDRLARAHRKQRHLTLETVSGLGNLSTRFLSEFERGKEAAEIGKILKALAFSWVLARNSQVIDIYDSPTH